MTNEVGHLAVFLSHFAQIMPKLPPHSYCLCLYCLFTSNATNEHISFLTMCKGMG